MRVLLISPDYSIDKGGLEKQIDLMLKYKGDIEFTLLHYVTPFSYFYSRHELDNAFVTKFIKQSEYDLILVMCNDYRLCLIFSCIQKANVNVPIILSISCDPILFFKRLKNFDTSFLSQVSVIRVQLQEYVNSYSQHCIVIPNMVELPKQSVLGNDFVTAINHDDINKNILILNQINFKNKCHVYGNIKNTNFTNSNIIVHQYSDIDKIYNNKCAYISTSIYEGMSNSVLEAMSYNLPIIACDTCMGANFPIKQGYKGYIYSSVQDLQKAVISIEQNPGSINYDMSLYSPEQVMNQWKSLFQKLKQN